LPKVGLQITYGETAFTVPLFDGFMKRIMPRVDD
jgi:hypothetical protein